MLAQPALVLQPATIEAVSASDRSVSLLRGSKCVGSQWLRLKNKIRAELTQDGCIVTRLDAVAQPQDASDLQIDAHYG